MNNKHSKEKQEDRLGEIARARRGFVAILTTWCIVAMMSSAQADWEQGTFVKVNAENAPVSEHRLLEAIRYTAWSWQERTGIAIDVAGTTVKNLEEGGIVYRWEDQSHFEEIGLDLVNGYTRRWIYSDTNETYGYEVVLNLQAFNNLDTANMRTMVHEMGHALGIERHSDDAHSVMAVPRWTEPARYALSTRDALEVGHAASLCHAELTREYDIYIPDINNKRATLKYQGNQEGQETWRLQTLSDNPEPPGCVSAHVDPVSLTLSITDLRSMDASYDAVLDYAGEDTWKLRWAQ